MAEALVHRGDLMWQELVHVVVGRLVDGHYLDRHLVVAGGQTGGYKRGLHTGVGLVVSARRNKVKIVEV